MCSRSAPASRWLCLDSNYQEPLSWSSKQACSALHPGRDPPPLLPLVRASVHWPDVAPARDRLVVYWAGLPVQEDFLFQLFHLSACCSRSCSRSELLVMDQGTVPRSKNRQTTPLKHSTWVRVSSSPGSSCTQSAGTGPTLWPRPPHRPAASASAPS